LWMINKFDVSLKFNEFAIDSWRNNCDKLRRIKDFDAFMVNKNDFAVFSIRWLFQYADTLAKLERFDDIDEILQEVELICTPNIPDYECFKQALHVRKENLNFLQEHGTLVNQLETPQPELTFADFLNSRIDTKRMKKQKSKSKSPDPKAIRPLPSLTSIPQKSEVIYIDSSDDDSSANTLKVSTKAVKKTASGTTVNAEMTPKPKVFAVPDKTPSQSTSRSKIEPTPKPSTRKAKAIDDSASDTSSVSARKTRRRMI
jgi:hypothetical protein